MKVDRVSQGVILAAGRGVRIHPISLTIPKPLLPVCNKPIMEYQIEAMQKSGINEIIVVLGHLGETIKSYFGDGSRLKVKLRYVWDLKPEGIAASLLKTEQYIKGAFALFLGDIFFEDIYLDSAINKFIDTQSEAVVVAKKEQNVEAIKKNFSITMSKNGRIMGVVEKPKAPTSLIKGSGVYIFNLKIFQAIRKTPKSALRGEYEITDSIQTLIQDRTAVYCDVWQTIDFNMSYPKDLLSCNLIILQRRGLKLLIGKAARLGVEVNLVNAIIGDRAIVRRCKEIKECLVLPKAKVDGRVSGYLNQCIFFDNQSIKISS